jgi:hypothetical protein
MRKMAIDCEEFDMKELQVMKAINFLCTFELIIIITEDMLSYTA